MIDDMDRAEHRKFLEAVTRDYAEGRANIEAHRPSKFEVDVNEVLSNIRKTLLEKNRKYGDSALNPVRLFSKASPIEQLKVRLDDKLSRLSSGQTDDTEDVELDLMGYLVMLRIAKLRGNICSE